LEQHPFRDGLHAQGRPRHLGAAGERLESRNTGFVGSIHCRRGANGGRIGGSTQGRCATAPALRRWQHPGANEARRRNVVSRHEMAEVVARERPELLMFCGLAGLAGNLMPVVTIVWATGVTEHHFIADTVSDLARGRHKWIMDLGFYVNAAGLLGLAIAAAHAHLGRAAWSFGIFCLAFTALVVVLLGLWDEFHDASYDPPGMTVHTKLTFVLGPLYLAGPLLMARAASAVARSYGVLFVTAAGLWLVFSTAFLLAPTAYDGILEKIAIGATMLWTLPLSWLFFGRGWQKSRRLIEQAAT
jgi:hypothetical protein